MMNISILTATTTVSVLFFSAALVGQAVSHDVGTVHTPEVEIGYETFGVRGDAVPVIAVNGGPGLAHRYMMVNDLWQKISQHRLVVFYDQRGTGTSKQIKADAPQTMDAQVADLDAVRAKLNLEKVALVGDSYGGMVVMAYAAAHPEHVAKLVLSDSPPPSWSAMVHLLPQTFPDIEEQDEAEQKALGETTDAAARAGLRNHFRMIFYSPALRDAYVAHMGDLGYEPAVGAAIEKASADMDLTPQLAGFTTFKTLVITGRYDMNVAPLNAWRMAHQIPGARVVFFEYSGHLPSYEEPARYRAVLEGFLNER
jgi:proline iminopeptidase